MQCFLGPVPHLAGNVCNLLQQLQQVAGCGDLLPPFEPLAGTQVIECESDTTALAQHQTHITATETRPRFSMVGVWDMGVHLQIRHRRVKSKTQKHPGTVRGT